MVKVDPTDADYEQACAWFFKPWAEIKTKAVEVAAERMLKENMQRQLDLIAEEKTLHGSSPEWWKNADAITRTFKEHDELLAIAYPRNHKAPR